MSAPPGAPAGDVRDRSARLRAFGLLTVLLGCGAIGLGLLELALVLLGDLLPSRALSLDPRTRLSSALVYGLVGGVLVPVGVGSFRRRRWAPPVIRVLATIWLLGGVLTLALVAGMLDDLILVATADLGDSLPVEVLLVLRVAILGATAAAGVALPACYLLAYRSAAVEPTCARHDSRPSRVADCPHPVLVLSLAMGLMGLLLLPMAVHPAVPLFGRLVTGRAGAALLLLTAAACGWLALEVFRRRRAGWWGTLLLLVLLGVSVVLTFLRVDVTELYRALGLPKGEIAGLDGATDWTREFTIWSTVALTLASVVYMLRIRRLFQT